MYLDVQLWACGILESGLHLFLKSLFTAFPCLTWFEVEGTVFDLLGHVEFLISLLPNLV